MITSTSLLHSQMYICVAHASHKSTIDIRLASVSETPGSVPTTCSVHIFGRRRRVHLLKPLSKATGQARLSHPSATMMGSIMVITCRHRLHPQGFSVYIHNTQGGWHDGVWCQDDRQTLRYSVARLPESESNLGEDRSFLERSGSPDWEPQPGGHVRRHTCQTEPTTPAKVHKSRHCGNPGEENHVLTN